MTKKKPKVQVRKPGLVINPPSPRPEWDVSPAGDLFKEAKEAMAKAEAEPNPSQPIPTHPNPSQPIPSQPIAPIRDYNKRANSIEREALPGGLFPGTSKKIYDALYARTRGAIVPTRKIQATKKKLMEWSGIKSKNTIALNLQILIANGLLVSSLDIGNHEGSTYEVILPEETTQPIPTHPNPSQPIPSQPSPAQKLGDDPTQKLGWVGMGNNIENKEVESDHKTSSKTYEFKSKNDDDEPLGGLLRVMSETHKQLTGKEPSYADVMKWQELGELLCIELKIAAARTPNGVSNVPAFFIKHLSTRLFKKNSQEMKTETESAPTAVEKGSAKDFSACPDCKGSGWFYPNGYEGGVVKCRHEKLL